MFFRLISKFNKLFNKKQKKRFACLFVLMIFGAILETLSISMMVPVMFALIGATDDGNAISTVIQKIIPFRDSTDYIVVILVCLIALFLLKNLYLSFQYWIQKKFITSCKKTVRKKLMDSYINRPYEFFLDVESGEIIRTINGDSEGTFNLLTKFLTMSIEIVVVFAIFLVLLIINPLMSVFLVILLIIEIIIISKVLNLHARNVSRTYHQHAGAANNWVIQTFRGIKEIIITRKKDFFVSKYYYHSSIASDAETKAAFFETLPRGLIEAVTMSGMLVYILIFYLLGNNITDLVPQLSAFAIAAVRLIPSFNRISSSKTSISYNEIMLDNVIEKISYLDEVEQKDITPEKEISFEKNGGLQNVSYHYPHRDNLVLDNADMVIPVGASVGVVGPSGAGKTTAIDIMLGLLTPQSGIVYADGENIMGNYSSWLSHIGYIPQTIFLFDSSIKNNVAFGLPEEQIDESKVIEALESAQLYDFVKTLPEGIETKVGEQGIRLSGGQRQRIGIARALYSNPDLLVFDEATSSLDNETEAEIMTSINALHGLKTMVIIAHRLSTIEHCDIIYRVKDGKITRER